MIEFEPGTGSLVDSPRPRAGSRETVNRLLNEVWDELKNLDSPSTLATVNRGWRARIISSLGSNEFGVRERARTLLEQAEPLAIGVLADAVKHPDLQIRRTAEELLANQIARQFPQEPSLADWPYLFRREGFSVFSNAPTIARIAMEATPDDLKQLGRQLNALTQAVSGSRDAAWRGLQRANLEQWSRLLANIEQIRDQADRVTILQFPPEGQPQSVTDFVSSLRPFRNLNYLRMPGCRWVNDAVVRQLVDNHPNLQDLDLSGTNIGRDGLLHTDAHSQLKSLNLNHCARISGEDIAAFAATHRGNLEELGLGGTGTNDRSLEGFARHARNFANLRYLDLSSTAISDTGARCLSSLPNLTVLDLGNTRITDRSIPAINGLPNLRYLNLAGTQITNQGLMNLGACVDLKNVNLSRTQIADVTSITRARFPRLDNLDLEGTQIDDSQLQHLSSLGLSSVNLRRTRVTAAGTAWLRDNSPRLTVVSDH